MMSGKSFSLWIGLLLSLGLKAQQTLEYQDPLLWYNRGLELYDKEKYAAAIPEFEEYLRQGKEYQMQINARFYLAFCHLELDHKGAEQEVLDLLEEHPDHPKTHYAQFLLGKYYYSRNNLGKAIDYFAACRQQDLTVEDQKTYCFMYGYALFTREKYPESTALLKKIELNKDKYYYPANYYLGYMAMAGEKDEVALDYFQRLGKSKVYGELSSVYVVRIYYRLGRYQDLLDYSDTLSPGAEYAADLAWERGKAFYQLGKYAEALPLLDKGRPGRKLDGTDQFIVGMTYYHNREYLQAHPYLTAVSGTDDALRQNALIYAADCFLRLDKKTNARNAFYEASGIDADKELQELAWFNYAKLTMEPPFQNEAVAVLKKFIDNYPHSRYADEAKGYLGDALLNARRYADAIPVIESIRNKTEPIKRSYQQICYYYANELLRQDPAAAKLYFEKARTYPIDPKLDAQIDFWMGEIYYKEGKTEAARDSWERFLRNASAPSTPVYNDGLYNLGYAYFDLKQYGKAAIQFRKYTEKEAWSGERKNKYLDGMTRLADCHYISKEYSKAIEAYTYVSSKDAVNSDYAWYQIGMIHGWEGRLADKVIAMKRIPSLYPNSEYVDDALYQIALVDLQRQNYQEALRGFSFLIEDYPHGIYTKLSHLKRGLALYNLRRSNEALEEYKLVVEKYPKSPETEEALEGIKIIYNEQGRGEELIEYLKSIKQTYSVSFEDSTLYMSAKMQYDAGRCTNAISGFSNYLQRFPEGYFVTQARFYRSECHYSNEQFVEALEGYEFAINRNFDEFLEHSLRRASAILIWQGKQEAALPYLQKLESSSSRKENILYAQINLMYAFQKMQEAEKAMEYATKVLANDKAQPNEHHDARLILGRILVEQGEYDKARIHLEKVEKAKENKNARGAEAAYYLCLITYKKGMLDKVESQVYTLDEKYANQVYWVARAYNLLGASLIDQKDYVNARSILQSILDNYGVSTDGVLDESKNLLARLDQLEGKNGN